MKRVVTSVHLDGRFVIQTPIMGWKDARRTVVALWKSTENINIPSAKTNRTEERIPQSRHSLRSDSKDGNILSYLTKSYDVTARKFCVR